MKKKRGPVVIAGLGGSGTRVLAQILIDLNYHMGSWLNRSNDNLYFTFLLKRTSLFNLPEDKKRRAIFRRLRILERLMHGRYPDKASHYPILLRAAAAAGFFRDNQAPSWRFRPSQSLKLLYPPAVDLSSFRGWGWKAPHSIFFLPYLNQYFDGFRYIHVMRHGLDMAFSSNRAQLQRWGWYYDVDRPKTPERLPEVQLDFWIKANRAAIELGESLGKDNFLLINFDKLCRHPRSQVEKIVDFLSIDASETVLENLCNIPRIPSSMGRYKNYDLSRFSPESIDSVQKLGFEVEI